MVKCVVQTVILAVHATARHARGYRRIVENRREIEAFGLPMILPVIDRGFHIEHVDAAHHLVDGAETKVRHVLPKLFRDEEKEIDHVLGLPFELLAQHRILRGDSHRAGVEMALTHHDTAHGDQGSRGESELFSAQQSGNAPVPPVSPLIRTTSACAFATPAATVPTPTSATSFTAMRACGFTFFKS